LSEKFERLVHVREVRERKSALIKIQQIEIFTVPVGRKTATQQEELTVFGVTDIDA